MRATNFNRLSLLASVVLAIFALGLVLTGIVLGWQPTPDEGWQAHLFQLACGLSLGAIAAYLLTSDWHRPGGVLAKAGLPTAIWAAAMIAVSAACF